MTSPFAVAAHWSGAFDEAGLRAWAEGLRAQLSNPVSLGLVFLAPKFFPHAASVLEILRVHAQVPLLAGCSSASLIANAQEIEDEAGIALALYHFPGATLRAARFTQEQVEEASSAPYWHSEAGIEPAGVNGWLAFADPFHLDAESWITQWNEAWPGAPIVGGLASGPWNERATQVYLNGEVFDTGGIGIAIGGGVALVSLISQGCTPIGETWTVTGAERNFIRTIGNRPAYQVLMDTFNALPPAEQAKAQSNLFIGLVTNEYLEEFHRGDFLVRNLVGADPPSGTLAIGALPRAGQTVQFQRRDAQAANEDLAELLMRLKTRLGTRPIYGGCLCCCNGRGERLFGEPSHDARAIQEMLGPFALAGFFCNGEIGPVGEQNFLHGYTASLALFVKAIPREP
ncbi:MAG: FIST C-terminal domain-containing protein [Verrucomicrobia bacterium]|nr:FIST C-terminal domain-containing protein [Verrucomicrobiota bacterium]